jgi:N-acylneuraminate cytidylyltransferase
LRLLAIIPARGGSKGVPKKNSKLLGDKPLIAYSIEAALLCTQFDSVVVSTDDENIAKLSKQLGAEVPFIRPAELATDEAKSIDVVLHCIQYLEAQGKYFDAVCLLQPTSPFRKPAFIKQCINAFIKQKVDTLISVLPVPHEYNPHWVFEPDNKGLLRIATGDETIIPRRQELPKTFFRDGSIYLTLTNVIKHQHSFFGNTIGYLESDPTDYVNIDTIEDWHRAETILKTRIN